MVRRRLLYMTNVEELKAKLREASENFGEVKGDSRLYEAKLFYLTGYMNGVIEASKMTIRFDEFKELLQFKTELLKEEN